MADYRQMWHDLGMDMENHDNLCAVLPTAVGDVFLSQEETLQFQIGMVDVQVNWTMANGRRASSDVKQVEISKQLLRQVVV